MRFRLVMFWKEFRKCPNYLVSVRWLWVVSRTGAEQSAKTCSVGGVQLADHIRNEDDVCRRTLQHPRNLFVAGRVCPRSNLGIEVRRQESSQIASRCMGE